MYGIFLFAARPIYLLERREEEGQEEARLEDKVAQILKSNIIIKLSNRTKYTMATWKYGCGVERREARKERMADAPG